jgi:hypothetical protein
VVEELEELEEEEEEEEEEGVHSYSITTGVALHSA